MKKFSFLAVAATLAIAATLFFHADIASLFHHADVITASRLSDMVSSMTPHAALTATVIRLNLADLTARATAKLAELKDDTAVDAARTIQTEHAALLTEIEQTRTALSEAERTEAEEATRTAPLLDNQQTVAAASRAADILDMGTRAGMPVATIQDAIRTNVTIDTFRSQAFDHLAGSTVRTSPARVFTDEADTRRSARIEALAYRLGAPLPAAGPSAAARGHMDDGMINIAAASIDHRSMPRNARDVEDIFTRAAHTTSDFPLIMGGAINRTLEARYALAQPTYRSIARQRNFRDFRPHTSLKIGDFPMLQRVVEDGEIKYGTLTEGAETLQVLSYARAISVSRQLMINDDLGAIADVLASYGNTVALFEEITFYSQAFNQVLADGKAVFHAGHNNLATAASAVDVANVSLGRASLAKQKSLDGNPLLSNQAAILMAGPDRITSAEMLVAAITPATLANINIFSGRLTTMSTAQLTDFAWYLFPRPELGSNYRWGYLEGYEAPRVRIENPFGRQGMAMSVEHDFGCGAVDYRYGYKNAGL
ncbi:Mu-like prophage major head subunit gpT family protein [Rhizobium tumorigenes]|uniref:phage major capsid protein n=1 Tax=Rhizobium tumorigenes TaxID=2041385 RepID=UPI00241E8A79|nr:Mu-like prophage major head subunit gpT family protein [Rhizobium tumorigenes]WFS01599.1 Mu-like prophage major head subunit gpT family protein [Rhizobium tumorigenes]